MTIKTNSGRICGLMLIDLSLQGRAHAPTVLCNAHLDSSYAR